MIWSAEMQPTGVAEEISFRAAPPDWSGTRFTVGAAHVSALRDAPLLLWQRWVLGQLEGPQLPVLLEVQSTRVAVRLTLGALPPQWRVFCLTVGTVAIHRGNSPSC